MRLQNGPITKSGVLPVNTLFFWKICFSFRTSLIELIWCTKCPYLYFSLALEFNLRVLFHCVYPWLTIIPEIITKSVAFWWFYWELDLKWITWPAAFPKNSFDQFDDITTLKTHHVNFTLKCRGNYRCHIVVCL